MNHKPPATILCIDDQGDLLALLARLLGNGGYRVVTVDSGKKAFEVLEQIKPDLILLDVMMPDMDGHEICTQIRKRPELSSIPVVLLTVLGSEEDKALAFAAGANGYLVKPIRKDDLLSTVRTYLEAKNP